MIRDTEEIVEQIQRISDSGAKYNPVQKVNSTSFKNPYVSIGRNKSANSIKNGNVSAQKSAKKKASPRQENPNSSSFHMGMIPRDDVNKSNISEIKVI